MVQMNGGHGGATRFDKTRLTGALCNRGFQQWRPLFFMALPFILSPLKLRFMKTTRAAMRQNVKRSLRRFIPGWEWFVLFAVLILLALFLLGLDWFGLNGLTSSVMALVGALLSTILAFVMAALIGPLIALITGLVATLIMPVLALGTGLFGTVVGWLATTWVGALFTPAYAMVAPVILKISPLLTMGKYGHKAYDWLDDQSWWPKQLVFTANKKQKAALAKARKAKTKKSKPAGKR